MHQKLPIDQPLSERLGRDVAYNEFIPEDYFRAVQPSDIFGNNNPVEVDLGCGDGSFLIALAKQYPERNFLGVERLLGRVKKVCKKAWREELPNVKVLRLDSLYVVQWLLAKGSIDRVHLICPDPWPKEKHHKKRLFQQPFLEAVHSILKEDGEFLFRTDHEEYYEWCCAEAEQFTSFRQIPWKEDDFFYPKSDFQRQWEAEGKSLFNIRSLMC